MPGTTMFNEENTQTSGNDTLKCNANDNKNSNQIILDTSTETNIQLNSEELDITKELIQTGSVNIYKEVLTENKTITIPIIREELVIEKKILNPNCSNENNGATETIRIPISEEQIDVTKHRVLLEDIKIYKHQYEDIKHITEILKREELRIKTSGNPKIVDK